MFEKSCRCKKSKKNFKMDIGPFYVDECCIEAGYDELGDRAQKELDPESKSILEAASQSPEAANLEVNDEGEQPEQAVDNSESETVNASELTPIAETKSFKKNKNKNR